MRRCGEDVPGESANNHLSWSSLSSSSSSSVSSSTLSSFQSQGRAIAVSRREAL
jgi:hypothetical protein